MRPRRPRRPWRWPWRRSTRGAGALRPCRSRVPRRRTIMKRPRRTSGPLWRGEVPWRLPVVLSGVGPRCEAQGGDRGRQTPPAPAATEELRNEALAGFMPKFEKLEVGKALLSALAGFRRGGRAEPLCEDGGRSRGGCARRAHGSTRRAGRGRPLRDGRADQRRVRRRGSSGTGNVAARGAVVARGWVAFPSFCGLSVAVSYWCQLGGVGRERWFQRGHLQLASLQFWSLSCLWRTLFTVISMIKLAWGLSFMYYQGSFGDCGSMPHGVGCVVCSVWEHARPDA